MGATWLDQPVMLHSSREDMCMLTAEQCAYRSGHWRYWYQADHVYALNTVYFFCATIAVCTIGFWTLKASPAEYTRQPWWQKLVAIFRFTAYRRYEIKALRYQTPAIGVMFLLAVGILFFAAMTLGPKPYYWPNTSTVNFGGSPPIATRAGWMALAATPFLILLATKANMIAALTGVSHERLIVFHVWAAWAVFVLALIHTFPFIVYNELAGDMTEEWNSQVTYWTGVVAIIAQAYLTFMSVSWIRNAYYEFFKATHFLMAIIFMVFFFIHCDFRLTSWDYFIAAGVLYAVSWLYSQLKTYLHHGIHLRATLTPISERCLRVDVPVGEHMTWKPGQHVFLRFLALGIHAFTAHPFTISSLPSLGLIEPSDGGKSKTHSTVTFYIEPRGGMTGRLGAVATKNPGGVSIPVLLEGPYGGVQGRSISTYDHALVIACGSGASFSLPFVMEWIAMNGMSSQRKMTVIIATRDTSILTWYETALEEFLGKYGYSMPDESRVKIFVHLTPSVVAGKDSEAKATRQQVTESGAAKMEKDIEITPAQAQSPGKLPITTVMGRPDITNVVRDATMQTDGSVGLAVCGPSTVLQDVRDEAAEAELRILKSGPGAKEVYVYSEVFGW